MLKKLFLAIIILTTIIAFGQKTSSELGIKLDNDSYSSIINDKYYTNGFDIFYRYLNKKSNTKINKSITEFKIGQYIYNPKTRIPDSISEIDRPFAGYIVATIGINNYYQNESVLKINFGFGFIGSNSFAEETQQGVHNVLNIKNVIGWQYQISNAIALQTNFFYSKKLLTLKNKTMDLHLFTETNLGTVLDGINLGLLSRVGFKNLLPVYNSNFYNAALNADRTIYKDQRELYFYIGPHINYQIYDATIQGSLFNDNSPVTYGLVPFRINAEAGLKYRKNSFNLSYSLIYKSKEVQNNQNRGYYYGSISASYLWN